LPDAAAPVRRHDVSGVEQPTKNPNSALTSFASKFPLESSSLAEGQGMNTTLKGDAIMPQSLTGLGVAALVFLIVNNLILEVRARRARGDSRPR
jgi:hypothetical protein